jgi:hypothetical protein
LAKTLIATSVMTALLVVLAATAAIGQAGGSDGIAARTIVALGRASDADAAPSSADAEGSDTDRTTGGGQILFSTRGAGNTIAFTAQGTADDGKGQLQFVDRSAGNGQDQIVYHGEVTCVEVDGNSAKVAGVFRDGSAFNLVAVDNGEGALADDDMIFFDSMAETPECDFDDPDEEDFMALARGNVQVYDAP